ncbi:hypothetical protein GDO86_005067 [Hymenochirus boettgeri]|uniref:G-protein coupled receptors family 1 profile domain-containing protein n=1 Tax=Hymenochirus boettgeri TaxID=247094 RepID=A0A8T2J0B2_9PIPI|nr:hypothetical protein GDO86_005067 [Hymenochirus boettgeri]
MFPEDPDLAMELKNLTNGTSTIDQTTVRCASFIVYVLTCVIGLVGNAVSIFIAGFIVKGQKFKVWFLNLASADFLFLLFLPFYAVAVFKDSWPYGSAMCKLYHFLSTWIMYVSIFIITALNIDRGLSVVQPIWHLRFFSRRLVYWICGALWASAFLLSLPVVFLTDEYDSEGTRQCGIVISKISNDGRRRGDVNVNRYLDPDNLETITVGTILDIFPDSNELEDEMTAAAWYQMRNIMEGFLIPYILIGYFLPLCIIILFNCFIAHRVKNSQTKKSTRIYKVVIAVILVFFLTWTPVVVACIIYIRALYTLNLYLIHNIIIIMPLLSAIAYSNCCLNPILYALSGRQVRRGLKDFIRRKTR